MEHKEIGVQNHLPLSVIALMTAGVLGLVCGLLLAPQSGPRTRRQLHDLALDAKEQVDEWAEEVKDSVEDLLKQKKKFSGFQQK
ncbi:MAG: YtxH domain-containing protein [Nitrospirales bacterium]|nr:YtxH domain-containing protein [Nitrospira sp.]MDR4502712.1 YtxH domain-containing protein [Nitrospirales bacterium]